MIKLICKNTECAYSYEVSEKELEEYGQYHQKCLICGSKLEVEKQSLQELVKQDLYERASAYLYEWGRRLGLEGMLEMIERNKNQACYRIYKDILEKRGIKIK
jgi:hypothetical protein